MAQTYSLALYSITIHKYLDRSAQLVLTDFHNGNDLYEIALEMFSSIKYEKEVEDEKQNLDGKNDKKEKKFFRIMKVGDIDVLKCSGAYITGLIESGEYGTEENIVNVETGESTIKTLNDALLRPFYFMLYIPKGCKRAILLLERISNIGILTVFEKKLQEAVSKKIGNEVKDYVITIAPLAIESVMKKHMAILGGAKKVILSRVSFADITPSKISDGELKDNEFGSSDLVFNAPRDKDINILPWFNKIKGRFAKDSDKTKKKETIMSVEGMQFGDVKFAVNVGGSLRTISMQDIDKLGTYMDVTQFVKIDKNGYPTFDSIDHEAHRLISEVKKQLEDE